ncbi:MAG TPA: hypothetical protein VGT41_04435 [Candidatus Babeliales bacterium]|nr:hypothetical protein [Candidatus Babeliales bacterium]
MYVIEKLRQFIDNLDEQTFYKYLLGVIAIITVIVVMLCFRYYSKVDTAIKKIENINELRDDLQRTLSKYQRVAKQRAQVDIMLTESASFKIENYFNKLLEQLHLSIAEKKIGFEHSQIDQSEYRERILKAKLTNMNMKETCELIDAIEKNTRVFIKELELLKSKKQPNMLDVNLTIATLEHKSVIIE